MNRSPQDQGMHETIDDIFLGNDMTCQAFVDLLDACRFSKIPETWSVASCSHDIDFCAGANRKGMSSQHRYVVDIDELDFSFRL